MVVLIRQHSMMEMEMLLQVLLGVVNSLQTRAFQLHSQLVHLIVSAVTQVVLIQRETYG